MTSNLKKVNSAGNDKINYSSYEKVSIYKKEKPHKHVSSPFMICEGVFQKVDFNKGFFSFESAPIKEKLEIKQDFNKSQDNKHKIIENYYNSDTSNDDSFELEFEEVYS